MTLQFEYDKLDNCGALDAWIASKKRIEVTSLFQALPDGSGTTRPVPLKVEGWAASPSFQVSIEQSRHGTMYLAAWTRHGTAPKVFLKVGSAHYNDPVADYDDPQCKLRVIHTKPYEKRMMVHTGRWSRRTIPLTLTNLATFYKAAARHLHIHLPPTPLSTLRRPQANLGSGAA